MLLNADQISAKNIVQNGAADSYRTASYDLQVGTIIDYLGRIVESADVPPSGMVRVVSRERLVLPADTVANATVKTSLCDEGVLAINIGIIDPGYEGLVSSTLINFGKSAFQVQTGDVFLRATFHQITPTEAPVKKSGKPDREYLRDKKKIVSTIFSATFLNVEQTATEAAKKVVGGLWLKFAFWVSVFALLLTAGTSLATTYNSMTATRSYIQSDQQKAESEINQLQTQKKDIDELRTQIDDLKRALAKSTSQHPK